MKYPKLLLRNLRRTQCPSSWEDVQAECRKVFQDFSVTPDLWKVALLKEMTEAGEEEKRLAEAAGDFCEDGSTPWITVVVDGESARGISPIVISRAVASFGTAAKAARRACGSAVQRRCIRMGLA
ncbi:hypothetical protein MTO96_029218 [Rhipicephalus appendiculatus]